MTFETMRKNLIKQGLIDKHGRLTQKGHEYVEEVKKEYRKNTKPFAYDQEENI